MTIAQLLGDVFFFLVLARDKELGDFLHQGPMSHPREEIVPPALAKLIVPGPYLRCVPH